MIFLEVTVKKKKKITLTKKERLLLKLHGRKNCSKLEGEKNDDSDVLEIEVDNDLFESPKKTDLQIQCHTPELKNIRISFQVPQLLSPIVKTPQKEQLSSSQPYIRTPSNRAPHSFSLRQLPKAKSHANDNTQIKKPKHTTSLSHTNQYHSKNSSNAQAYSTQTTRVHKQSTSQAHTVNGIHTDKIKHTLSSVCVTQQRKQRTQRTQSHHMIHKVSNNDNKVQADDNASKQLIGNRFVSLSHSTSIIEKHNFAQELRVTKTVNNIQPNTHTVERQIVDCLEDKKAVETHRIITLQNKNVPAGVHLAIAVDKNRYYSKNALKKITRKLAQEM